MATLKQRLHRKNSAGTYDTIHYETSSDVVMRPSGRSVEQDLAAYLPEVQDNDNVPESLLFGTFFNLYGRKNAQRHERNCGTYDERAV